MMKTIRVAIYEDNVALRDILATIIRTSDGFALAGEFGHCLDAVTNTTAFRPDVILMDIDLPGRSGIAGVADIKRQFPDVEILMHTVFEDADKIFDAIRAGATGYILKNNSLVSLLQYIREVHGGGAPMSPVIARKVLQRQSVSTQANASYGLSDKEHTVVSHLAAGLSYKMVAAKMNISIDTVRSHVKKIYEKLQVHSVTEAVYKIYHDRKT